MLIKILKYYQEFCQDVDLKPNVKYGIDKYYIFHSESLWCISTDNLNSRFKHDEDGVLLTFYDGYGYRYNPAYIAYYGLISFNKFLDTKKKKYLENFESSIKWIVKNGVKFEEDGILCKKWVYDFDWQNGLSLLKSGWCSAMAQGLIASILIRSYFFYDDEKYLNLAKEAINIYKIDIEKGGVRAKYNNNYYYEEYPTYPLSMVLDGLLFALVGAYELSKIDIGYQEVFNEGIKFIEDNFDIWNYKNIWTKYGIFDGKQYLATFAYHKLNLCLIDYFKSQEIIKISEINNNYKCFIAATINLLNIIKDRL